MMTSLCDTIDMLFSSSNVQFLVFFLLLASQKSRIKLKYEEGSESLHKIAGLYTACLKKQVCFTYRTFAA